MTHVPIEETFPMVAECFPDLDLADLVKYRDHVTAFTFSNMGFALTCPYNNGYIIQYLGVRPEYRNLGVATSIINQISEIAGSAPIYAEVTPGSSMYRILSDLDWRQLPISYVCPAWGNEPADHTRCLMTDIAVANHLDFIQEFYSEGYRNPSPDLIARYRIELNTIDYEPIWEPMFKELFSQCFEDDINTIMESIERAKLKLVLKDDKVVAFMLYNPYDNIKSVVVEYVGVAESERGNGIASHMFESLKYMYRDWAIYGEVHAEAQIVHILFDQGWQFVPINWVCPAWGDIPEDTTRQLVAYNSRLSRVPEFAENFYSYGYGVDRPDLVAKYKGEIAKICGYSMFA